MLRGQRQDVVVTVVVDSNSALEPCMPLLPWYRGDGYRGDGYRRDGYRGDGYHGEGFRGYTWL